MSEYRRILNKDTKITISDLNRVSKWSRVCIYLLIFLILGTYLIFKPSQDIMGNLVLSAAGLILAVFGYLWGIQLQYIPGNWKGGDISRPSSGIKGVPAQVIGYTLFLIGLGAFLFGLFRIFQIGINFA